METDRPQLQLSIILHVWPHPKQTNKQTHACMLHTFPLTSSYNPPCQRPRPCVTSAPPSDRQWRRRSNVPKILLMWKFYSPSTNSKSNDDLTGRITPEHFLCFLSCFTLTVTPVTCLTAFTVGFIRLDLLHEDWIKLLEFKGKRKKERQKRGGRR